MKKKISLVIYFNLLIEDQNRILFTFIYMVLVKSTIKILKYNILLFYFSIFYARWKDICKPEISSQTKSGC